MSLTTFSVFYFGHTVTAENNKIDFKEAVPELTATLNVGTYSLTDFVSEIKRALDAAGANTYTVSVNRTTRFITISTTATFELLVSSGSHAGTSAFTLMGFTGADRTGAMTYTGDSASGSAYYPQFVLQDHISTDDWQSSIMATVNKSANGEIEVVRFGTERFLQANIKYITDKQMDGNIIKNNQSGVDDAREFMQYITTKAEIEYMSDEDTPSTFQTVRLESTPDDRDGLTYKLKELYDKGLPGIFDTGPLKFRLVE
jgi:hypothetical protein